MQFDAKVYWRKSAYTGHTSRWDLCVTLAAARFAIDGCFLARAAATSDFVAQGGPKPMRWHVRSRWRLTFHSRRGYYAALREGYPRTKRASPDYPNHLSNVPRPLPRRIERVPCRLLPRSRGLPQMAGGSASALSLSRPAQASLTLRPAGSLSRLKRPLSRGSNPCSYPHEPLVSYRINRQLSGWILPPLMIRAFGAHCH
jgi:hypothetical protein